MFPVLTSGVDCDRPAYSRANNLNGPPHPGSGGFNNNNNNNNNNHDNVYGAVIMT